MATITGNDIQGMVRHWLNTPTGGYLGSDYGQDANSLLQRPLSDGAADAYLQKLRRDVPIIGLFPGAVGLYRRNVDPDKVVLEVRVAGQGFEVVAGGS